MKALINKIIKFSSVDGPGNRMAIFFQGCNIHCNYCHNPETIHICNNCGLCVKQCPVDALSILNNKVIWNSSKCIDCDNCIKICPNFSSPKVKEYSSYELLEEIKKVKNFIRGITFSGGECSLNHLFILELIRLIREELPSFTVFVDTNGYIDFSKKEYKDFVEEVDAFMLDIKAFDEKEHIKLTGKSNKNVLKNLNFLLEKGKIYELRTVVVPKILKNEKTVSEIATIIENRNIKYKLIKYRSIGVRNEELINIPSPTDEYMNMLKNILLERNIKDIVII